MAVMVAPETDHAKELAKWEQHHSQFTIGTAPGRPYVFREYPKMLYRGAVNANGKHVIDEQKIVQDRDQETIANGQGWFSNPTQALECVKASELEKAKLAAERNFEVRRMSGKARAEVEAFEAEAGEHVAEIPAVPIKPRGRPRKVVTQE